MICTNSNPQKVLFQIVKQLWAYIRKNNLQDPNNKRKIICNEELRLVFETDCTDMFKMNKLLAKHIIPLEPTSIDLSLKSSYVFHYDGVDAYCRYKILQSRPFKI